MADSTTINCPKCKAAIPLTESLAKPLIERERKRLEREIGEREAAVEDREGELTKQESALKRKQRGLNEQIEAGVAKRLTAERKQIEEEAARNAQTANSIHLEQKERELDALRASLGEHRNKLAAAQANELDLERERNQLKQKIAEVELEVERRVHKKVEDAAVDIKESFKEYYTLEIQDRESKLAQMRTQVEDLQRRLSQGSQQLQGESQEITIEQELRAAFPMDTFTPVPKGEAGADLVQTVIAHGGQVCGAILWESKRTKNWSPAWLEKLRADQRGASADVSILVSQAVPADVTSFKYIDDVWVARRPFIGPMASMLRLAIIRIAIARATSQGRKTKAEMIYDYLTGTGFANRVVPVIESLSRMRHDVEARRARVERELSREEQRIRIAEISVQRLIGDIQGIAGIPLEELDDANLPALGPGDDEPSEDLGDEGNLLDKILLS